ncbi:uncharacterized protein LOC110449608 [Mizuhopecten yessoensis]|uniref:DED domain-containing protein n=1 Tax=Mizuhopecten yessoensis TaxID=6573 RepID=A0A210QQW1_MIZYE|nr:uncharacterized protein LOC110449608 [Mizuhopecten yessoensis]OWF51104.1 hypothetical protein KP79_PYT16631 [Mizuhopecten yessoensis]
MASGGFPDPGRPGDDRPGDTPLIPAPDSASSDDPDNQTSQDSDQSFDTSSGLETSRVHVGSSLSPVLMPASIDWKLKVFLMNIARNIDEEDLDDMKFLMKGECGMGKRALSEIKTVKQFFNHMMEIDFVNNNNLLQLQNLLWHLGRKDLHIKFVEFARDYKTSPLHFFIPNREPRNGYVYADFHIGGSLETTSRQELEILRTEIAELMCVPPKFIFIKGLEPLHSLIVTLMVPAKAAFALFELSEVEKSILQSLRIDSFGVGDKRVVLANFKFEKAASLSEKDEIQRILKKKELLTSELDKSQARLIERGKKLSSSEEELAEVKITSDQLKLANDHAMMILATLVYQDLAHNSSPTDSLSRLSILTYFKFCLNKFQIQYPEAADHVGDLLDANALVVRKTERDLHKNYVERLQIHQLALEYRCQTVQPVYTLSDHLFQRPSEAVRRQFINTKTQQQLFRSFTHAQTPGNQHKTTTSRKKLFDRRTDRPVPSTHPYHSALKEISLKLKETQKEKLLGNLRFNKVEECEVAKQPEKFLQLLFEKELGAIPADPCEHVLKKLRLTGDQDLQVSANKLLSKRKGDLNKDADNSSSSGLNVLGRRRPDQSSDTDQSPHVAKQMEQREDKSGVSDSKKTPNLFSKTMFKPGKRDIRDVIAGAATPGDDGSQHTSELDIRGVHKSASESALRRLDSNDEMHEKLNKLLSEIEWVKIMLQNQAMHQSPVGMGAKWFPATPTEF